MPFGHQLPADDLIVVSPDVGELNGQLAMVKGSMLSGDC